jgi:hypothetical protein
MRMKCPRKPAAEPKPQMPGDLIDRQTPGLKHLLGQPELLTQQPGIGSRAGVRPEVTSETAR